MFATPPNLEARIRAKTLISGVLGGTFVTVWGSSSHWIQHEDKMVPTRGGLHYFRKTQNRIWSPFGCQPGAENQQKVEKACFWRVPGGDLAKSVRLWAICGHGDPQK